MAIIKFNKVLIIGGTGFIGTHLISRLIKDNYKIDCILHNSKKKIINKNIKYFKLDLTNNYLIKKKLRKKYDYVINLMGYIDHSNSLNSSNYILNAHFFTLINIVNFFLRNKNIKSFINIGSSDEYGQKPAPQNELMRESPETFYSLGKTYSTHYLQMMYKLFKFPCIIIRLFIAYGPLQSDERLIPYVIKSCLKNKKFYIKNGNTIRDFCFIDDVVNAIIILMKSKNCYGNIFNLGHGKGSKISKLVKIIQNYCKGGKVVFIKNFSFKKEENKKIANISKIKKFTKWRPKVNLNEGLKKTINYYKI
jgi:nucleoside-diphosphate-sugar epimerase